MKPSHNEYSFTTEGVESPTINVTLLIAAHALTTVSAFSLGVDVVTAERGSRDVDEDKNSSENEEANLHPCTDSD